MITKEYIIKITGENKEHKIAKNCIDSLFKALNSELEADMEIYVKPVKDNKNWGSVLYGLGSKENLTHIH